MVNQTSRKKRGEIMRLRAAAMWDSLRGRDRVKQTRKLRHEIARTELRYMRLLRCPKDWIAYVKKEIIRWRA